MKKTTRNWIATSDYDLTTAGHMLQTGRHLYVIYMCHLAVEKLLKAIVAETQSELPPKTHNLYHLVKLAAVEIDEQFKSLLADLNAASLPVRYPEDLEQISKQYTKTIAEQFLHQTQGCVRWLKQHPTLKKS